LYGCPDRPSVAPTSTSCTVTSNLARGRPPSRRLAPAFGCSSRKERPMSDSRGAKLSRRELLKAAAVTSVFGVRTVAGEPAPPSPAAEAGGESVMDMKFARHDVVRVGIIGVGGRGTSLLRELVDVEGARVVAVCDVVPAKTERAQAVCVKK